MQGVTKEELQQIIKDAKKQGKDVSKLEKELEKMKTKKAMEGKKPPPMGEIKEKKSKRGEVVIESTGPAREDDFE